MIKWKLWIQITRCNMDLNIREYDIKYDVCRLRDNHDKNVTMAILERLSKHDVGPPTKKIATIVSGWSPLVWESQESGFKLHIWGSQWISSLLYKYCLWRIALVSTLHLLFILYLFRIHYLFIPNDLFIFSWNAKDCNKAKSHWVYCSAYTTTYIICVW